MNLEIGTKLKVVKDIYYIVEDSIEECSYLTKEELFESVSHLLVKDDVWVVVEDNVVECVEGRVSGMVSGRVSGKVSGRVSGKVSGRVSGMVSGHSPRKICFLRLNSRFMLTVQWLVNTLFYTLKNTLKYYKCRLR